MPNYDEDYWFQENLKQQKEEEKSWIKQRRKEYEERQQSIKENPPDEDAWNR